MWRVRYCVGAMFGSVGDRKKEKHVFSVDIHQDRPGNCTRSRNRCGRWRDISRRKPSIQALIIQGRVSEVFSVDIHPAAKIGKGIVLDHATGVVIGETLAVGNQVSILHNVTLGGTGKCSGDRHPKIGNGVSIGAGASILGNILIEDGAKIGAGSIVLKPVPARATVVGNPAKLIGGQSCKA